jgi:hypothetical protein
VPGGLAQRERGLVLREGVLAERPRDREHRTDGADPEDRRAAQAQRHDREPHGAPGDEREQRAARVGQQQRDEQQGEHGIGQRVDRGVAVAARAEPQAPWPAEGRDQPDGVPVPERLAEPGERLVGVQRRREHLRHQRVRRDHGGRDDRRVDERAPAAGGEAHERDAGAEGREVGQRAARLQPGVVGLHGPGDAQPRQARQQRQQRQRQAAVHAAAGAQQGGGAEHPARGLQRDLDRRGAPELQPAPRAERDGRQERAEGEREQRLGRDAAPGPGRAARRLGARRRGRDDRGHVIGWTGRRRGRGRGPGARARRRAGSARRWRRRRVRPRGGGVDDAPADGHRGVPGLLDRLGQRGALGGAGGLDQLRRRAAPGGRSPARREASRAAAGRRPPGSAELGAADHVAAVGVLVDIGGDVAQRRGEVLLGVLPADRAVLAVADDVLRCRPARPPARRGRQGSSARRGRGASRASS